MINLSGLYKLFQEFNFIKKNCFFYNVLRNLTFKADTIYCGTKKNKFIFFLPFFINNLLA